MKQNKAQIAVEFLLLLAVAMGVVITLLIAFLSISQTNSKIKNYYELEDLGQALQQEFFLAAELEDGYTRKINLPLSMGGNSLTKYDVSLINSNNSYVNYSYIVLSYGTEDIYYAVPYVSGQIRLGDNILVKNNNSLRIN